MLSSLGHVVPPDRKPAFHPRRALVCAGAKVGCGANPASRPRRRECVKMVEGECRGVVAALYPTTVSGSASSGAHTPTRSTAPTRCWCRRQGQGAAVSFSTRRSSVDTREQESAGQRHPGAFTGSRPSRPAARIDPAETAKAREIRVGRIDDITPLHREDGEMRVGRQVAGGPQTLKLAAQPVEMRV
jgi:hypothetical protein